MWCRTCQQDVPAVASTADATVRCARCQNELSGTQLRKEEADSTDSPLTTAPPRDHRTTLEPGTVDFATDATPRSWESWELEEDLRAADRLVTSLGIRRADAAHDVAAEAATMTNELQFQSMGRATLPAKIPVSKASRGSFISWSILSFGLMTFAFGAVLLGWSFWMDRAELWRIGMPFTMAGQAALIIGLALQLDGLWRSTNSTTKTLADLDDQLGELRHTTTLLSTSHSGPSQSFYSHMASGAGPHLLLADLKSQLDLLAIKLADIEK